MNRGEHPLPRWARAADYIFLLLVAVAITIAASGGFRVRVFDWHVALTSPGRVILWAIGIAVLRHVVVRRDPVYAHLASQLAAWARSTPFRSALTVLLGTRPAVFFVGYLAIFLFGYAPGAPPYRDFDNELFNLPNRWDVGWYLQIAIHGYTYIHRAGAEAQQNIVFFPAFPLTVRIIALLLGGSRAAFFATGTLVSLAAFLGGLAYIYLLARDELDESGSRTALWMLAAYPFALFYGAIYTESLFLLGTAGAFYHIRRHEYVRAGLWGLLVGLTRPNGFFLAVPIGLIVLSRWIPSWLERAGTGRSSSERRAPIAPAGLGAAAMPVVGMLAYSAFVWSLAGSPFAWLAGHAAWGRHYSGLTVLVTDRYKYIATEGLYGYVSQVPIDLLNALGVIFVLACTWGVARRLGLAYAVFILINLLPPLAQGGLLSAGRFSSVLFPAFIWLAAAVPARYRAGWIASFAAIQALNAMLFYTWRQLY